MYDLVFLGYKYDLVYFEWCKNFCVKMDVEWTHIKVIWTINLKVKNIGKKKRVKSKATNNIIKLNSWG